MHNIMQWSIKIRMAEMIRFSLSASIIFDLNLTITKQTFANKLILIFNFLYRFMLGRCLISKSALFILFDIVT